MTTKIPITPEALARLTPAERQAFEDATERVAAGHKPPMGTVVTLAETIQRLITEPAPATAEAVAAERARIRQLALAEASKRRGAPESWAESWAGVASRALEDFADLITEGPHS